MEQGTGKTLVTIATIGKRFEQGKITKVLIAAPLSVASEWERQFEEHANFEYEIYNLLDMKIPKRVEILKTLKSNKLQIIIINYDAIRLMVKELTKWNPHMIVCDESQKIKNPSAKVTKSLIKIGKESSFKMILTGTPISKGPVDIYSQMQFLDEKIMGMKLKEFKNRYMVITNILGYPKVLGYKVIEGDKYYDPEIAEEFYNKIDTYVYRITKKEALDLPVERTQNIYSFLEARAFKRYKELKDEALLELKSHSITAALAIVKILRLQQFVGGFIKTDDGITVKVSNSKLKTLFETIEELYKEHKLVIFARFIPEVKAISKKLKELNIAHSVLTGKTKNRGQQIKQFQTDNNYRIFISQIQTGGIGITLTAADTAIFYSLFSLIDYEQAKARIHRIGQTKPVTYIHILADKTHDLKIFKNIIKKVEVSSMVLSHLTSILE